MILVHTESLVYEGERILDYETQMLDKEMDGILARGLEGLYRLLENNGLYTVPETSSTHVKNLEMDSDIIGQFIDDVEHGEVKTEKAHLLVLEDEARIERPVLWETFNKWQENSLTRNSAIGKHEFFDRVEKRGFEFKRLEHGRYFLGIGLRVQSDPIA